LAWTPPAFASFLLFTIPIPHLNNDSISDDGTIKLL